MLRALKAAVEDELQENEKDAMTVAKIANRGIWEGF